MSVKRFHLSRRDCLAAGMGALSAAGMPRGSAAQTLTPYGYYWIGDFSTGDFSQFDTHETWQNVYVNDPYFGNNVAASALINTAPPFMPWAHRCCRMIIANTQSNYTKFPSGSASGTTINLWEPGAYHNVWESLTNPPRTTWFRVSFLIPDGTNPSWPGKLTPVNGDGLNNSWHVMAEWHGNPGGFSSGGGTGESHKLQIGWGGAGGPALFWRPTAGGGPYPAAWGMFYETDRVQNETNGAGGDTGPVGGNIIPLKFNHWYDCVWKMLMVANPNSATPGCMKWWVDGNLRVSAKMAALQAAGDGSVPAISFQAGMYRNYPTWGGNNVTNTTNANEHIYIGPMVSGPTAASVGSSVSG